MKKRRSMILAVVIVAIIGYVLWTRLTAPNTQPPGTLAGNGVIEATEVDVTAEVAGKVKALPVQEGDEVKQGLLIAVLNTGGLQGQVEQAQGNLNAAQAALAELLAGSRPEEVQRARAQYVAAEKALQQAQASRALVYAGPRPEELAQLQDAYEQAIAQRDLLRAGNRPEQIKELHAAVDQAKAQLDLVTTGPRAEDIEQLHVADDSAQVTLANANIELHRMEKLAAEGAVARDKVDQATLTRDLAADQEKAAKVRLDAAIAGSRPQEIKAAQAAAAVANRRLADTEAGPRPQELAAADKAVEYRTPAPAGGQKRRTPAGTRAGRCRRRPGAGATGCRASRLQPGTGRSTYGRHRASTGKSGAGERRAE